MPENVIFHDDASERYEKYAKKEKLFSALVIAGDVYSVKRWGERGRLDGCEGGQKVHRKVFQYKSF